MKDRKTSSNESDFRLKLENGGSLERLKNKVLPDDSYFFENELEIVGDLNPTIITCTAWLLELFELETGEIFFRYGEKTICPATKRFGILYPPFSITQPHFKNTKGYVWGIAATQNLPSKFNAASLLFENAFSKLPVSVSKAIDILNSAENIQPVEINPKASLLSIKAKKLIDENYLIYPSIGRIADRLGVTHAHLTRQFKHDFGMSPNSYFRQLRVADVPLKLARGEEIISVSHDVGYNDLSRFYKQFRQTTQTSPGACQTIMKSGRAE